MARLRHRISRFVALAGVALLLTSCSLIEVDSPLTTFDPAGPNADRIDGLFWMVFWIATAVFVLVMGALVLIVVVFRDRDKDSTIEPKQLHGNAKLEVMWTVIPALILAAIAVPTTAAVFDLTGCASDAMPVEVTGHQWWFEYHYPDQNIDTANVLVMPVDQEVCLEMTSDDVIHNFWIPALMGKRYVVPGQITLLRMEADETGEYWGHCAEFCGLSHSLMRARAQVLETEQFEAWAAAQQAPAAFPPQGSPEWFGHQVFVNKGCVQCHTVRFDLEESSNIVPSDAFNGPDLTHFASRHVFAGATLPEDGQSYDAALKEWLADPPNVKPGSFMPNLALTSQEIDSLMVWLEGNK